MQVVSRKYLVVSIFMLLLSGHLFSQKVDYSKVYEQAKTELKNKNFDKALDLFKQVSVHTNDNPHHINATYFYAYCALKQKQYWSANHYLNKIIEKYPDWNKINEVHYLLTKMAFEKHEYSQAIVLSKNVKSKFMKTDLDNMKWSFLNFPSLQDTVTDILKKNPTDTCVASILYTLVKDDSEWKSRKIAKNLVEKYGFIEAPKEKEVVKPIETPVEKDTLSIAVVLPFNLTENIKDNTIRNDLYLFDLYTGMRLAADSMRKAGAKIRFVTYDYGLDSTGFYSLIDNPELKQYDIIIGPLQNSLSTKVKQFAETNKTVVINPLSTSIKFTEGSNLIHLFKPSNETQITEAANFAYSNFYPRKALIISGKNSKDSTNAVLFKNSFEKAGGTVLSTTILTSGTLAKLGTAFSKKNLDSTGVIFVSSKDQNLAVNILRKLTEIDRTTPLLVDPAWLEFQSLNFEQMQKQNMHFIAPEYVNYQNDTASAISNYLQFKTNSLPSQYTFTGYELIYMLCNLAQTDTTFFVQTNLKGKVIKQGLFQHGIDYSKGQDNRLFGIYRFTDEGFVKVNY